MVAGSLVEVRAGNTYHRNGRCRGGVCGRLRAANVHPVAAHVTNHALKGLALDCCALRGRADVASTNHDSARSIPGPLARGHDACYPSRPASRNAVRLFLAVVTRAGSDELLTCANGGSPTGTAARHY